MKTFNELNSLITSTDSYKVSHWLQYPQGTDAAMFYIESRGGKFDEVVTAGVNFVARVLAEPITMKQVE